MANVYVRLSEPEVQKILASLSQNQHPDAENLLCKIELLLLEMQPGTCLTPEAVAREKTGKKSV
jgi:hypothetical protein